MQLGQFLVAAPSASIMAFVLNWDLPGLIAGLMLGVVVQACCYIVILTRVISWPRMAARVAAEHRAEAAERPGDKLAQPPEHEMLQAVEP